MASTKCEKRVHAPNRTRAEWVTWSEGEGLAFIVEKAPNVDGDPEPGFF